MESDLAEIYQIHWEISGLKQLLGGMYRIIRKNKK